MTENTNEGADSVQSLASYTLSSNIENLTLTGTSSINGTGNALDNTIIGNTGNNILNGGLGVDSMTGGLGNDTYVVDDVGDVVIEDDAAGTDTIQSSVTYVTSSNVERLALTGAASINATGNALNNTLTGNTGNNTLNGLEGADAMVGGAGDDIYIVDNIGDVITESASAGTDSVESSVTYTLSSNVENLTLTGTEAINGTGNASNNTIIGNEANNILNGGTGVDILIGGVGDDVYIANSGSDVVTENASEGTDTVQSSASFTLSSNIENLTLTGTSAINGVGNALDNIMTGNAGANTLSGADGNDAIIGGSGNDRLNGDAGNDVLYGNNGLDTLFGGTGSDTFMFTSDSAFLNIDVISDFKTAENDKINVADLLQGYDPITSAITDFIQITTSGANSILRVDADGGANNFVQIATLSNVAGLTDEAALVTNGNLIVS